jgi:hypothetical protein
MNELLSDSEQSKLIQTRQTSNVLAGSLSIDECLSDLNFA